MSDVGNLQGTASIVANPFSYTSHLEMLRHMIYTPFWLVLMVFKLLTPIRSSRCPCSLKLVQAEEDS